MARKKINVDSIRHNETRANIPTEELRFSTCPDRPKRGRSARRVRMGNTSKISLPTICPPERTNWGES